MKKFGGILIMPSSQNESSLKNVISVMLDQQCVENEQLPKVNKILFIETESFNDEIIPDYRKIISALKRDELEIRSRKINNPVKDIPPLIMSAVREVGSDNIILDLTCGLKELTGSLYTAAIISGIDNITYTSVYAKPKNDGGGFYDLSVITNKRDYYSLKRFGSLDEMETLAAMNNIEFIAYKQKIFNIRVLFPLSHELDYFCSLLESAVDYYFSMNNDSISSSIQKIGVLNEELVGKVARIFKDTFPNICKHISVNSAYKIIDKCQKQYITITSSKKEEQTNDFDMNCLTAIFENIPMLPQLVNIIRLYRNKVSHDGAPNVSREDAKLCIEIYIKILNSFCESEMGILLFNQSTIIEEE